MSLPYGYTADASAVNSSIPMMMMFNPMLYGSDTPRCFGHFLDLFLDYQYIIMGLVEQDASQLDHIKHDIPVKQRAIKTDCGISGPLMDMLLSKLIPHLSQLFAYIVLLKIAYDEAFNGVQVIYS